MAAMRISSLDLPEAAEPKLEELVRDEEGVNDLFFLGPRGLKGATSLSFFPCLAVGEGAIASVVGER